MRITCPYCGERDSQEFTFLGQAGLARPDPSAPDAQQAFHDYVHIRTNPAGPNTELWLHANGCRSWIVVSRNTLTHEITGTDYASPALKDAAR